MEFVLKVRDPGSIFKNRFQIKLTCRSDPDPFFSRGADPDHLHPDPQPWLLYDLFLFSSAYKR